MKNVTTKSSKAKGVVLTVVLVIMAAMIAALAASVIMEVNPKTWFTKSASADNATSTFQHGDLISFNSKVDGKRMYISQDMAVYSELKEYLSTVEGAFVFFFVPSDFECNGFKDLISTSGYAISMHVEGSGVCLNVSFQPFTAGLNGAGGGVDLIDSPHDGEFEFNIDCIDEQGLITIDDIDEPMQLLCFQKTDLSKSDMLSEYEQKFVDLLLPVELVEKVFLTSPTKA